MPKRRLQVSDLAKMVLVSDVQIEPGGQYSVGVVKRVSSPSKYGTRLYRFRPGKKATPLTNQDSNARSPRFVPGSEAVSFISKRGEGPEQVYILPEGGGEAEALTNFPEGSFGAIAWSPDGKKFAVTHRPTPPARTEAARSAREKRKESDPPIIVDTWPYRLDGDGYPEGTMFSLSIVDARTGKAHEVKLDTDDDEFCFDWLADGSGLVIACRPGKQLYMEPWHHDLLLYNLADNSLRTLMGIPMGIKYAVKVSPSGRSVAFCMTKQEEKKWGMTNEYVGVYDLVSGQLEVYLEGKDVVLDTHPLGDSRDACPLEFFWSADESRIYWPWALAGQQHVWSLDLASGEVEDLTPGFVGEVHIGSFAAEAGVFGTWVTTPTSPTEVAHFGPQGFRLASNLNSWLKQVELAELSEFNLACVEWEGTPLQCWRLAIPQAKGPAVVSVHGGPQCMYTTSFFFELQILAAEGHQVFFCNPRGSTGYGMRFASCIEGDWGNLDWKDVKTLTDHVRGLSSVDKARVGIIGGSYGGFMTNWAISHSHGYCRAVTDRCVSNLLSKWGNSDYLNIPDGWWPGGAFYDSTVLWECSPIKHFAGVKTPTLVVHSEGDLRCNIEQGEQVYAALKILGVETKFIRYPRNTSHGMSRNGPPDLRMHRIRAYVDWLGKM